MNLTTARRFVQFGLAVLAIAALVVTNVHWRYRAVSGLAMHSTKWVGWAAVGPIAMIGLACYGFGRAIRARAVRFRKEANAATANGATR